MGLPRTLLIAASICLGVGAVAQVAVADDVVNTGTEITMWGLKTASPPPAPPAGNDEGNKLPAVPQATAPVIDETQRLVDQLWNPATQSQPYIDACIHGVICRGSTPAPAPSAALGTPTVTIRDLATFIPSSTTLTMEPAHWMLRDAPTNFIAHAEQHTVTAPLLGQTADVRFTPIGFTYDYGDGTTLVTDTGGHTWADLGVDEFTQTETSHVYTKRGNYTITAAAVYTAEYRVNGGPWTPVTGTISIPTTHTGRTVTIDTVLVRGTCDEYPEDPGCPKWNPPPDDE